MSPLHRIFLPYQIAWIRDESPLKLIEKSRQIGITLADAYDSVRKVCQEGAQYDVWISSRDEKQARLYLEDCKKLAALLHTAATDHDQVVTHEHKKFSARVLEFPSGRRIYSLSSNPDALAGKRGHVKLDEFALHQSQRKLYQVAKPVTQWGGQLSIISTHRGAGSVFNEMIREIREGGNPMGWSLHSVPLAEAVEQGLVEKIYEKNLTTNEHEWTRMAEPGLVEGVDTGPGTSRSGHTREEFLRRIRAECIDEEQWQQEYCCTPGGDETAFIGYEVIIACEDAELRLMSFEQLREELEKPGNN